MKTVLSETGGYEFLVKKFIGRTIMTNHTGRRLWYQVEGVSKDSVSRIRIGRKTMAQFFYEKHGVVLKNPELICLLCDGSNKIPLDLAIVADEELWEALSEDC